MNILEGLFKSATQPAQPLHVGEVMALWTYYAGVTESRVLCMLLLNHTNDGDLKALIEHFIADVEEPQISRLDQFLRHEGIPMPPGAGDKPGANEMDVPQGAKFTDFEIANLLVVKLDGLMTVANMGLLQSARDDVGALFYQFYTQGAAQGFTLKKTMRERGWLRVPPPYPASKVSE